MPHGEKVTIEKGYESTVDAAADALAKSVAHGVTRKPLGFLLYALGWVVSLPLQAFAYLSGN